MSDTDTRDRSCVVPAARNVPKEVAQQERRPAGAESGSAQLGARVYPRPHVPEQQSKPENEAKLDAMPHFGEKTPMKRPAQPVVGCH